MKQSLGETAALGGAQAAGGIGPNAAPVASGCVRWCMNVALQSFAGEPWAVQLRPLQECSQDSAGPFPGKQAGSSGSTTSFHAKTTTQATALENQRATAVGNAGHSAAGEGPSSMGGGGGHAVSSTTPPSASGDAGAPNQESLRSGAAAAATGSVIFGEGFGASPVGEGSLSGLEHVTAAERCGIQLCTVDYDDGNSSDGSDGGSGTSGHPFPMPSEELEALRECVQAVNDPPVTYGNDELLARIANVEFIPSETPTPEGLLQYSLHSSLEPVLRATLQPAVTAVVDHCVSSMVLVYGATQEMKQMGLIGTPEECGLLPHGIRMFMDRYMERKEQQALSTANPSTTSGSEEAMNRMGSSTNATGAAFVFPPIGASAHRFTRIEASFIAFDAVNVVDLLDLGNKHIELVLRLAPPPTPSEFEDTGADTGTGRPHRPTTDSFVLNARVTPAESTNDALSALDVGLENLARALEASMFQSESGSSLLFSLTAYTDACRCATFHVLCLAEDPAAQTWLASTILARSQAIPLGEEQSWASIQNTPMPPPLHHHAATILVPALCFGNMFTSVLICVYNSMTALGRLNRDLTLAVTGYRMRTIPRVTSATTRRSTKKLPTGWEEHFTEDGRRYFTDTNTQLSTWADPRLTPGYQQSHRNGTTGSPGRATTATAGGSGASVTGSSVAGSTTGGESPLGSPGSAVGATPADGSGPRSEGSNAYAVGSVPQQPRRSRVGLGQGDRDFLTRALQQQSDAASGGAGADAPTGRSAGGGEIGEDGIPVVDVGIVVIDTECRPRVVLNSANPDFMAQFTHEQQTLAGEKERRQERLHQRQQFMAASTQTSTATAFTASTPADGAPAEAIMDTTQKEPSSARDAANDSADPTVLPLTNHSGSRTSESTPGGTASGSVAASSSLQGLPRTHTQDDVHAAPAAASASTTPPDEVVHRDGEAPVDEPRFCRVVNTDAERPPLDPRHLALNPDLDDDEDDDMLALSRSDATSIDDFVFDDDDDDDDDDFASAVYTPADDAVLNTRRFYQNAMQEQIAMPLEEARGTSVASTPVGLQTSVSPTGGSNPGSPGSCATPASVAISPDMQDLESLVEEFSKFFAQAYQAEEEVRKLREEVRRLKRHVRRLRHAQTEQCRCQPTARKDSAGSPLPSGTASAAPMPRASAASLAEGSDEDSSANARRGRLQRRQGSGRTFTETTGGAVESYVSSLSSSAPSQHQTTTTTTATTVAPTNVPVSVGAHLLYAPTLLSDAQSLILLRTNASMRSRLEPVLTSLAAHVAASPSPLLTDVEGTESSTASRPTRSPVSRVTSPVGMSVKSFYNAVEGGGGDRAVLLSVLESVLKAWQASEAQRNGSLDHH